MIRQKEYLVTVTYYGEGDPVLLSDGKITIRSQNAHEFGKIVYENETTNSCASLVGAACDTFKDILLEVRED